MQVNYFVLRGEPVPRPPPPEGTEDDVADIRVWTAGERRASDLVRVPNVHEQVSDERERGPDLLTENSAILPQLYRVTMMD